MYATEGKIMSKNKDTKKSWKDDKKEIKDKKLKETTGGHYPAGSIQYIPTK